VRKKRLQGKVRHKDIAEIEQIPGFTEPIVHINIQTGEGFCRIRELWEHENVEQLPTHDRGSEAI